MKTVARTSPTPAEVLAPRASPALAAAAPQRTQAPHPSLNGGTIPEPPLPRGEHEGQPTLRDGRFWAEITTVSAGVLCSLVGVLVMAGWLLASPTLTRLRPSLTPMVFNTAAAFLVCGLARWPRRADGPDGTGRYGSRGSRLQVWAC